MDTRYKHRGVTLLELLIVVGILMILASAVVLVLEPEELLKRSRDSARISDLQILNSILGHYSVSRTELGVSFGDPGKVYISLPDDSPVCANLTLPGLPSGWTYNCVTQANLQKTGGTGWIPLDFTQIIGGAPVSSLPIDPSNSASGNLFYAYVGGSRKWELTAQLESKKFNKGRADDKTSKDGGDDPNVYEAGSQLTLNPMAPAGYWAFDEGNGTTAGDSSKNGNHGTLINGPAWTSGKVGGALSFDGANDYVDCGISNSLKMQSEFTLEAWIKGNDVGAFYAGIISGGYDVWDFGLFGSGWANKVFEAEIGGVERYATVPDFSYGEWAHVVMVFKDAEDTMDFYFNGSHVTHDTGVTQTIPDSEGHVYIGIRPGSGYYFNGLIDDVRIYNRALSADEIKYYYNISK